MQLVICPRKFRREHLWKTGSEKRNEGEESSDHLTKTSRSSCLMCKSCCNWQNVRSQQVITSRERERRLFCHENSATINSEPHLSICNCILQHLFYCAPTTNATNLLICLLARVVFLLVVLYVWEPCVHLWEKVPLDQRSSFSFRCWCFFLCGGMTMVIKVE